MKVNRPDSPLSSASNTPLDQQGSSKATAKSNFARSIDAPESQATMGANRSSGASSANTASVSATRAALQHIADQISSTGSNDDSRAAVRESARYLIQSSLNESQRGTASGVQLVEDLSAHVADDPLLGNKLFMMLANLKSN